LISEAQRFADCAACSSNCCARLEGKILLTLKDVARLVDAGHADAIVGTFRGFASFLDQYLTERDPDVFNAVNVMMSEKLTESTYMPSLKKVGDRCVFLDDANRCKVYQQRPEACRRYPFDFDHRTRWITWDPACPSTTPIKEGQEPAVMRDVVNSENERLRDIALVMLSRDALVQTGFGDYL
jgi:Fe-S-cluster containining protein